MAFEVYKKKYSTNWLNVKDLKDVFEIIGTYSNWNKSSFNIIQNIPAFGKTEVFETDYTNLGKNLYFDENKLWFSAFMNIDSNLPLCSKKLNNSSNYQKHLLENRKNLLSPADSKIYNVSTLLTREEQRGSINPNRLITPYDKEIYDLPISSLTNITIGQLFQMFYDVGYDEIFGPGISAKAAEIKKDKEINTYYSENADINYFKCNHHKINDMNIFANIYDKYNSVGGLYWSSSYAIELVRVLNHTRNIRQYPVLLGKYRNLSTDKLKRKAAAMKLENIDELLEAIALTDEVFSDVNEINFQKSYNKKYNVVFNICPFSLIINTIFQDNISEGTKITDYHSNKGIQLLDLMTNDFERKHKIINMFSWLEAYFAYSNIKFVDLINLGILKPRKTFSGYDDEIEI